MERLALLFNVSITLHRNNATVGYFASVAEGAGLAAGRYIAIVGTNT